MSSRYFKLVSLYENDESWIAEEFFAGRARYGWSPQGADLSLAQRGGKPWEEWPEGVRWAWSYAKFLVERISVGDRVVIQTSQPLRSFLVGEVIEPGYEYDGSLDDFNHVLHVRPLVPQPVPVNSHLVSDALKHDLSKRGRYYEIYPERSIKSLDELVERSRNSSPDFTRTRKDEDTRDQAAAAIKSAISDVIRNAWPAQNLERFCDELLASLPYVEVKERVDRGLGWDLLVRFINPITNAGLMDEVPVQCKNYVGAVNIDRPIDDLERCIRNLDGASYAMLFILGDLSDAFHQRVREREASLSQELGRGITFDIVDEGRIAEIYAASLDGALTESGASKKADVASAVLG